MIIRRLYLALAVKDSVHLHFHYVLSMGALFAMLGGFYFWIPKIVAKNPNELLAQIQFWTLFFGVNITFFPMHYLGVAGLPRRYSDYPDAYAGFNMICTYGSMVSILSTLLFIYIVFDTLKSTATVTTTNPWSFPLYFDLPNISPTQSTLSLEWVIQTPPTAHNYSIVPKTFN